MPKWREKDEKRADREPSYAKIHRRKQVKSQQSQWDPWEKPESEWTALKLDGAFRARVVEVHKRYCFVSPEPKEGSLETSDPWLATVARRHLTIRRGERNFVTVGDQVLARPAGSGDAQLSTELPVCVLEHMAPRKSKLARPDPLHPERDHVIAANVDQLLVVASFLTPKIRFNLIDRYLVLAEEQGLEVHLVFTKADLLEEGEFKDWCERELKAYEDLGYPVYKCSLTDKAPYKKELKRLGEALKGKISVLSGHSGVGKSSLVNMFKPEIVQVVEDEPETLKAKGRHTTSYAALIGLRSFKAYVIDTPGIRSFALAERTALEWAYGFRELRALLGQCKYRECRHIEEPGCSVLTALEQGKVHQRRYDSYEALITQKSGREGRLREADEDLEIEEESP